MSLRGFHIVMKLHPRFSCHCVAVSVSPGLLSIPKDECIGRLKMLGGSMTVGDNTEH